MPYQFFSIAIPDVGNQAEDLNASLATYGIIDRHWETMCRDGVPYQPVENHLPPYFQRAIWRSEGEVRVYIHNDDIPKVQDGDSTDPTEVFCQISPESFSKMKFYIDPSIGGGILGSKLAKKLGESTSSICLELLLGGRIKPEQFISCKEAELNPDDEKEKRKKKKKPNNS